MNALYRLLSNSEKLISTPVTRSHSRSSNYLLLSIATLLISLILAEAQPTARVISISPSIVPFQGGATIYATGEGFASLNFPKCQIHTQNGVLAVNDNTVLNDTMMQCILPTPIPKDYQESISASDNKAELEIIGGVNGTLQITFFDLNKIIVSSITPDWTYISLDDEVVILHGSGFINTYEITCHSILFEVKAIFVNASQLMCLLPRHSVTTKINIDVYSIGQPSSAIQKSDSIMFTYFATPPEVVFFTFNPSYTSLILQFDREIELGNETQSNTTGNPNCLTIFDSLDIFGSPNPTCHWQNTQQRQIIIQLNSNSTVLPNMTVSLQNDVIRTRHVAYSKLSSGELTILENANILHPIAVIEGPQVIPHCGSFTLSGLKSYNSGSRPLKYQWHIEMIDELFMSGENENLNNANDVQVNNLISDHSLNQSTISLPSDMFLVGSDYHLTLTVTNFLGNVDSDEAFLVKQDKPALNVWIIGRTQRLLDPAMPLFVEGRASAPDCLTSHSGVSYQWVLYKDDTAIDLDSTITTNEYLQLESYTLNRNTSYVLSFYASVNATTSSANVSIRTTPVKIKASIYGGSAIVYGYDDRIVLDAASGSTGLFSDIINDQLLIVQWTCLTANELSHCTNTSNGSELNFGNEFVITIPSQTLSPGTYMVTVRFLYSDEVVSEYLQVVYIRNDTKGLKVYLEEPLGSDKVDVHSTLIINGIVESSLPGAVMWSCVYKPGNIAFIISIIIIYHSQAVTTKCL